MSKYVELHKFADARFVASGFTHFMWAIYDAPQSPVFSANYGAALPWADDNPMQPQCFARYNPDTQQWALPLADDAVPALMPFHTATWDNDNDRWIIQPQG